MSMSMSMKSSGSNKRSSSAVVSPFGGTMSMSMKSSGSNKRSSSLVGTSSSSTSVVSPFSGNLPGEFTTKKRRKKHTKKQSGQCLMTDFWSKDTA